MTEARELSDDERLTLAARALVTPPSSMDYSPADLRRMIVDLANALERHQSRFVECGRCNAHLSLGRFVIVCHSCQTSNVVTDGCPGRSWPIVETWTCVHRFRETETCHACDRDERLQKRDSEGPAPTPAADMTEMTRDATAAGMRWKSDASDLSDPDIEHLWTQLDVSDNGFVRPLLVEIRRRRAAERRVVDASTLRADMAPGRERVRMHIYVAAQGLRMPAPNVTLLTRSVCADIADRAVAAIERDVCPPPAVADPEPDATPVHRQVDISLIDSLRNPGHHACCECFDKSVDERPCKYCNGMQVNTVRMTRAAAVISAAAETVATLAAERDAALVEISQVRQYLADYTLHTASIIAERDVARQQLHAATAVTECRASVELIRALTAIIGAIGSSVERYGLVPATQATVKGLQEARGMLAELRRERDAVIALLEKERLEHAELVEAMERASARSTVQ